MNSVRLLTQRFIFSSAYHKTVSTLSVVCFLGIAIGTFSLSLITGIMRGFEIQIHTKMQGIHADAIMQSFDSALNIPAIEKVLAAEFDYIKESSPYIIEHALIQTDNSESPAVIMLKGVDPLKEERVSTIRSKLLTPITLPKALNADSTIVIGKSLAEQFNLKVGDTTTLLYLDTTKKTKKISVEQITAQISALFSTGIDEYDSSLVYCSDSFLLKHFPQATYKAISLTFQPTSDQATTISKLKKRFALDVYSWKELYPALVSALKLEKYAMFCILLLITLVASMTIISLLYMLIHQKKSDIALLRSMGMPFKDINKIFLSIGCYIALLASTLGIVLSIGATWVLQNYPFIQLPDAYYVSHLPAQLEWSTILIVWFAVLCIAVCATWIGTRATKGINISTVLRFEG